MLSAIIVLLIAFWFLGVDRSWFVEGCKDCNFHRDVREYRILGIPIIRKIVHEYHPVYARVARDLGAPCPHLHHFRWHKHRWWGLCYCAWPCINGTFYLYDDDSWYSEEVIAKVKQKAIAEPKFGEEFRQQVLYNHNWDYWKQYKAELLKESINGK
jgi:hypothetical protein